MKSKDKSLRQQDNLDFRIEKLTDSINNLLERRISWIVILVIIIGFMLRIVPAGQMYFNPDECWNYLATNQFNLYQVWLRNLNSTHPPLFFFILFLWAKLSNSELFLRLISILAGTASIYVGYLWVRKCFGKISGLVMSLLLAFSPALIWISQEVRAYSLLVFFMLCSLYYFQQILDKRKILHLTLFSIFSYLAILTFFSAAFLFFALLIYFVYLFFQEKFEKKFIFSWMTFQLAAIVIYGFLYRSHLSHVSKSGLRQDAIQGWLASSFLNFQLAKPMEIFLYPFKSTNNVFSYLFASNILSIPLTIIFAIAVLLLILKNRWRIGILLILPLLGNLVASIFKFYPYGETRHIIHLSLFAYSGIAYLFGKWFEKRLQLILIISLIFLPFWIIYSRKPSQYIEPKNQHIELMQRAKEDIINFLPKDEAIFMDFQTSVMLGYYFGKNEIPEPRIFQKGFWECRYAGFKFVAVENWSFTAESFVEQFRKFFSNYLQDSTGSIWIIDAGWGWNLRNELLHSFPEITFLRQKAYAANISIFQLSVEEVMKLETPSERAVRITQALQELSKATQNLKDVKYRTIFWPNEHPWETFRTFWIDSTLPVVQLKELNKKLVENPKLLDNFLPALVFWILYNREKNIQIFSFMDEGHNYIAAGYAFTLRYINTDGLAAVYEINWAKGDERIILPTEK